MIHWGLRSRSSRARQPAPASGASPGPVEGAAPGVTLLRAEERSLFVEAFHKELDFLELLLLLVNRSFPFKNVDLIWAGAAESGRVTLWQGTGTSRALRNPHLRPLHGARANPNPRFCNLVNDWGRRDAETCLLSDLAAAERARRTGKVQVYTCHAGITDIAVPVRSGAHHLATLHCGQCLREPPSETGFARIARRAARLGHVDLQELKKAYYELPVVTPQEVRDATQVLGIFADSLGRLWERLRDAVRFERQKLREIDLLRIEFAHLMLGGGEPDRAQVGRMMRRLGFDRYPNRVLVLRLEPGVESPSSWLSFDVSLTKAQHAVEEAIARVGNAAAACLRPYGVCVFFHDPHERAGGTDLRARGLAQKILQAVAERCDGPARVGIGSAVKSWRRLSESYEEAREALALSGDAVALYSRSPVCFAAVRQQIEEICRCFGARTWEEAGRHLRAFPALVFRHAGGKPESLPAVRHIFVSALDRLCFAAQRLGVDEAALDRLRAEAEAELERARSRAALEEAYLRAAERVLAEVRELQLGKHEKIVERARRMIDWGVEHPGAGPGLSLESVAAALGVSAGHLSRLFSRHRATSFRRYLNEKRLERARRLLLDPLYNVAQVAEACGYPNAAYFARAFRRATGMTPSRYARRPPPLPS